MSSYSLAALGRYLLIIGSLSTAACTASQESAAEVDRAPLPATIRTDADRQAAYNSNGGYGGAVPDATPGRVEVREQASGINSRKRVESVNTNDPNNTTNETRLRRLNGAPVDTLRRLP